MNTPKLSKAAALELIAPFNRTEKVIFLGIRGYFQDSMGVKDENDIGIYDDAIFIISPNYYGAFNGNTDPSKMTDTIAMVKANQVIMFTQGIHGVSHSTPAVIKQMQETKQNVPGNPRTYWAYRQASDVTVLRNGEEHTDSPANRFWTNLHCGGLWTTSSLGCQTVIKDQWPIFKNQGYAAMDLWKQKEVPYILIDQPD